jgi:cation diffusion facilitator CzcD-associated flavoprotein CzcO
MSLSDEKFAYGPFAPHWVPKQYIQNYFASHRTDRFLVLNTTVEEVTRHQNGWNLTLRRYDPVEKVDIWWEEQFDAVVIANGHYSVPYVLDPFHLCLYSTSVLIFLRFHTSMDLKLS